MRLEAVDVEHDQRQRPAVAGRARQLAVEELQQVALVVDVGQGVDDGQAVDFLVVLGLDVAAGQEAVDAVADAQVIAVLELADGGRHVVDEGAVGALQIDGVVAVGAGLDAGVAARDGMVVDADVAVVAAAEDHGRVGEGVARAHARPGRVDVDDAGVAAGRGDQPVGRRHPGFGRLFHARLAARTGRETGLEGTLVHVRPQSQSNPSQKGGPPEVGAEVTSSFPSSAWERLPRSSASRRDVFADELRTRSGASPPCVPKRSLGTRTMRRPCRRLLREADPHKTPSVDFPIFVAVRGSAPTRSRRSGRSC